MGLAGSLKRGTPRISAENVRFHINLFKKLQRSWAWPLQASPGLSGPLWASLGFSGPLWASLGFSGPFWTSSGLSGLLWASVDGDIVGLHLRASSGLCGVSQCRHQHLYCKSSMATLWDCTFGPLWAPLVSHKVGINTCIVKVHNEAINIRMASISGCFLHSRLSMYMW